MTTTSWSENGTTTTARWRCEHSAPAPGTVVVVDDRTTAKAAHRTAESGVAMLWRGSFSGARRSLQDLDRRLQRLRPAPEGDAAELFHAERAARARRAEVLGAVLVVLEADHSLALRGAPDVREACAHAYGLPTGEVTCVPLRELLGVISAHQWHLTGVDVPALGARIHPDHGVFSPVRGEYVDLVAAAPVPVERPVAFDLGTGTGVLAAVLARRGARVVATDINPRAVACARANVDRLGLADRVVVEHADLWPAGRADLVVCNPPWIPARPTSALELGVYDEGSDVLHRFLGGLAEHLEPGGEGWLVLSDLAERLGLRTRAELLDRIADAGLRVEARYDTAPRHPRASDPTDPLHSARREEVTSLWRLTAGSPAGGR
ncbi:class I SAM-dependent methyltransferase [Saccharopolyspora rhizosphaerae]|uniref:Class I SAM-dependent methyltransferase n=1 Tax=Saccharopolyspora rhizosphaerae TaxID=2492662 RepID=A0A3R8R2G4_9PSEU|nr:class I SAM-dependent methyltransferase [Saccharopolyspora rhizosphaerae]RRO16681.1 class I SAM-dependent methyltransferase [Saccharopolyspora rhizosphaerae]